MNNSIKTLILNKERELAKLKAVAAIFPDACNSYYFKSKLVNKNYSKFEFEKNHYGLYVSPYSEIHFEYNGGTELIKVYSSPRRNRLAYLSWNYRTKDNQKLLKFSRLKVNLKNNSFKEDMINACYVEIMAFIKDHSSAKIDDKHLDPRLKKLMAFN